MLKLGLYEEVISEKLKKDLDSCEDKIVESGSIDKEEASKILTKYISEVIEKALDIVKDGSNKEISLKNQIDFANKIVSMVALETKDDYFENSLVIDEGKQLLALIDKKNSIYSIDEKTKVVRPVTSIAQSSLFTGADKEPQMYTELKKEIVTCDNVDMLVSFIKWSGLRLILKELEGFTKKGGRLRIITTSYMGATDVKAIEELAKLSNTDIRISYDTKRTRLHAKTYIFHRYSGFSTAYVGSSNLSKTAMSSGLEWNLKITKKDLPDTISKIDATFESYWNSKEFEIYTKEEKGRLIQALRSEKYKENPKEIYEFNIYPYSYQQEILDKLQAERIVHGFNKNLIVAATGTGKTVIAGFDYLNFCRNNEGKPCRLLFIAHREEILRQSIECFRGILKDQNFGELFVGIHKPESADNLFMSIQTFNSQNFTSKTDSEFYDYIVIDEFHHASASSYQKLLEYYKPKILLGLTATPERMDGKNVLEYFNNRISAEIRLPEAIDRKLLCPFQYFGVTDTVDIDSIKWKSGGYDKSELSKIYTMNDKRTDMIINSIYRYVTDLREVRGIGFCVSKNHAEYMSTYFNHRNIKSIFLTSDSLDDDRKAAKQKLRSGEIKFIFVVDLYNEGVDIPEINTILFLRPTESLTVFLQQLGRGLRITENKECLTVLDFIGQSNKKYNFADKFYALLSNTNRSIKKEIDEGFISAPKGCYIELEQVAKKHILDNIKSSYDNKAGIISMISSFEVDSGESLTLENFLKYHHMDIRKIYAKDNFSRLCACSKTIKEFEDSMEKEFNKAFKRICSIDSRRWITFLLDILPVAEKINLSNLTEGEIRMLQMFQFTFWGKSVEKCGFENLKYGLIKIKESKVLFEELMEILRYNYDHIDFIDESIDLGFDCPLDLHCSYTRDQIFVALDYMTPEFIREGVRWLPNKKIDVFINTLNKSDKDYSPTTMYKDYSINEWLFHWQSQSTTSETSQAGVRYINHKKDGSKVLLFVRENNKDICGNREPFTFLGVANYVSHEGNRPMNIVWKLEKEIPSKFLKKSGKLIVV